MKPKFKNAVDEHDVISVRIALASELMMDPRGTSFHEMLQYAEAHVKDLYEEDDGESLEKPIEEWNHDYLFSIKNKLDFNFSKQKLLLYERVAKEVLKEKAHQKERDEPRKEEHANEQNRGFSEADINHFGRDNVYKGVAVGGAALAVVGLCASKTILTVVGLGAAAFGGYKLYKEYKK